MNTRKRQRPGVGLRPRQRIRRSARTPRFEHRLLRRSLPLRTTDRVLELGYDDLDTPVRLAAGTVATELPQPGHIVSLRPTVDLAEALESQLAAPTVDRAPIEVRLADVIPASEAGTYDVVLLLAPFYLGNERVRRDIITGHQALRPGGTLYLQAHRRQGAETFARCLAERFGAAGLLGISGGHRLYGAVRGDESAQPDVAEQDDTPVLLTDEVRGLPISLEVEAGVFSRRRVDPASCLLAETMEIHSTDEVVDLGCGTGLLGILAALLAPQGHVLLLDNRVQVVALAQRNLHRNGITNAEVRLSDGLRAAGERAFDVVVTNPPLHESGRYGTMPAARFVAEAAGHLRPGGRLYVVGPRTLPLPRLAEAHFERCEEAAADRRSVVWCCTRPRSRSPGKRGLTPTPPPAEHSLAIVDGEGAGVRPAVSPLLANAQDLTRA